MARASAWAACTLSTLTGRMPRVRLHAWPVAARLEPF